MISAGMDVGMHHETHATGFHDGEVPPFEFRRTSPVLTLFVSGDQPIGGQGSYGQPDKDDDDRARHVAGAAVRQPLIGLCAEFRHDIGRHEPNRKPDEEGQDDQFVKVPENRDEIRDQVDGAESIGHRRHRHRLGMPRHSRVPTGQV
jgi:hypothetical protein